MALPSYASASALAHEVLRGEPLLTLGQARDALRRGDATGALTAVVRGESLRDDGLDDVPEAEMAANRASALVLRAMALRILGRPGEASPIFREAVQLFASASQGGPLVGCALAEHATALVLTRGPDAAADLAETAVLSGDMLPEDVLLLVTAHFVESDQPARAERMLRRALDRGPVTPPLLGALEKLLEPDDAGVGLRLALVESLLEAGEGTAAIEVADRLADRVSVPKRVAADVLRAGVRLAAGPTGDVSGGYPVIDDLDDAPAIVQQLAVALAADGRHDVVAAGLHPARGNDPRTGLLQAASRLTAGRPRDALLVLEGLPAGRITLRLRAAAQEGLGSWAEAATALRLLLDLAPDDSELIAAVTRLDALAGQSDDALSNVEQTLTRRPWDAILLGAQAALLAVRGQHAKAVEVAERALALRPGLHEGRTALAAGLLPTDVHRSIEEADTVLSRDPANVEALYVKGRALHQQGDVPGATVVLRRLEQVAPWHHPGMLLLAQCLEADDTEAARQVYVRLLAEHPLDPAPYVGAARLEWQQWRLDRAGELIGEALERSPEDAEALAGMAEVLRRQEQPAQAEPFLLKALEQDPTRAAWLGTLGQLRIDLGHLDEGVGLLRAAIETDPSLTWAMVEIGDALRVAGRPHEAMAAFEQALAADPDNAWTRASTATALLELHRYDEALDHVDAALRLRPDYAFAWAVKGHVHLQTDDLEQASAAFDRAVQHAPTIGWLYATRAYVDRLSGTSDRVTADLLRAIELDPDDVHPHVALGYVRLGEGDSRGATALFDGVVDVLSDPERQRADSLTLQALVWARLGLRDWQTAVALASDLVALDRDVPARLTYGLALLCASSFDDDPEPDISEYLAALRSAAATVDPRNLRFVMRAAELDLVDAARVTGPDVLEPARTALASVRDASSGTRAEPTRAEPSLWVPSQPEPGVSTHSPSTHSPLTHTMEASGAAGS